MSNMTVNETVNTANEQQLKDQLSQMKLLGEAVFTNLLSNRGHTNTHTEVINALRTAGLDEKLAKEIKPAQAFSRASACKTLKKNRVIDLIRDDKDDMLFQFSKKFLEEDAEKEAGSSKQFSYPKEVKVMLDKNTGEIVCRDDAIKELAQRELDRCLMQRTTTDISTIVQKLFQTNADLIPLAVGSWFIPLNQTGFVDRVQTFLKALGRNLGRLPIPSGTEQGDRTICESVVNYIEDMVDKLKETVKEFTLSTRPDTVTKTAEKYSAIQSKLESFDIILGDRKDVIKEALEQAQEEMRKRVEELAEEKKTAPASVRSTATLFGHSVCSVMHRLGASNWPFLKAKKAVMELADTSNIKEDSLRTFWSDGKNPKYSKPAELTADQLLELETAANLPEDTEAALEEATIG